MFEFEIEEYNDADESWILFKFKGGKRFNPRLQTEKMIQWLIEEYNK